MNNLRNKTLNAVGWRGLVDIGEQILLIIFTAILARLLTKEDFGLIAMALLVNRFVYVMTQVGFSTAIIQGHEITESQVSAIFFIQLAIGFSTSIICHLLSPFAAEFFHAPKLVPVIQTLSWLLFLNSLTFPMVFLQKKVKFRGLSLLEIGAMLVSNAVGIIMAFLGFGMWALVSRLMIHRVLFTIGVWPLVRWKPAWPCLSGTKKIFNFGLKMYFSNIASYFSHNVAAIIVGRYLGVETLGSFNIAYNLAIVPAEKVRVILAAALFPAFSLISENITKLKKAYYESLLITNIFFIPLMLGVAAISTDLVRFIYGEKWKDAGYFLSALSFVGLMKGIEQISKTMYLAKGWANVNLLVAGLETICSLPLMYVGMKNWGIEGLIFAYLTSTILALVLNIYYSQKAIDDDKVFFKAIYKSVIAAVVMYIGVSLYRDLFFMNLTLHLITQIFVGAIIYCILRTMLLSKPEKNIISQLSFFQYAFKKMSMR